MVGAALVVYSASTKAPQTCGPPQVSVDWAGAQPGAPADAGLEDAPAAPPLDPGVVGPIWPPLDPPLATTGAPPVAAVLTPTPPLGLAAVVVERPLLPPDVSLRLVPPVVPPVVPPPAPPPAAPFVDEVAGVPAPGEGGGAPP